MGSPQAAAAFIRFLTSQSDEGGPALFDTTSLQGIHDIRAEVGRLTCLLKVMPRVENRNRTLHGGCIATLVDVVGTGALLTQISKGGVSLSINTNYLRPLPHGAIAFVDATVLRIGKSIATINVEIRDNQSMKLAAQGIHVKFISETDPDLSIYVKGALHAPPPPPPPKIQSKL